MLKRVLETIKINNMLKAGDKVVCALSGGADSMALLCALYEIKDDLGFFLYAAHLNHGIRGEEADEDTRFVSSFCEKIGVELFVKKVDVPAIASRLHISEEECGRNERYFFFEEVSEKLGGCLIATGHHKNDNAETVLFNLFRGSGGKGIKGIPYKRDNIIRPLLDVTRAETESYLQGKGISWRDDSTNKAQDYSRNRLRLVVLKEIERLFPDAVKKITSAAEAVGVDDEYLSSLAEQSGAFVNGRIIAENFMPLHESLRRRVVMKALKEWGVGDVSREKIRAVYETVLGQSGKGRDLGADIRIVNSYGMVYKAESQSDAYRDICFDIKVGETREIATPEGVWSIKTVDKSGKMRDNKMMILLDADKMGEMVSIRCRRDGDIISPIGMEGKKKLKKLFIDLKIPQEKRDTIFMLTEENEVLFIPGIRKTGKYKPDDYTKKYFVAKYTRL